MADGCCRAKQVPHKIYLMEHAKSADRLAISIRFSMVTQKLITQRPYLRTGNTSHIAQHRRRKVFNIGGEGGHFSLAVN